jgi:hypothetical protein
MRRLLLIAILSLFLIQPDVLESPHTLPGSGEHRSVAQASDAEYLIGNLLPRLADDIDLFLFEMDDATVRKEDSLFRGSLVNADSCLAITSSAEVAGFKVIPSGGLIP